MPRGSRRRAIGSGLRANQPDRSIRIMAHPIGSVKLQADPTTTTTTTSDTTTTTLAAGKDGLPELLAHARWWFGGGG